MQLISNDYLAHHGILGQKWGVRRYQNEDGSLTTAGKSRYYKSDGQLTRKGQKRQAQLDSAKANLSRSIESNANNAADYRKYIDAYRERYTGEGAKERYAKDMGVDDDEIVKTWSDEEFKSIIESEIRIEKLTAESYENSAKKGKQLLEKYSNMTLDDIDRMSKAERKEFKSVANGKVRI